MSERQDGLSRAVADQASEHLGVRRRERPLIFREVAGAAVDADLAYWSVLLLSGAIATLGVAINSAAVVIGAMLIAPLLAPVLGLALALAVGDTRLMLQSGAVVLLSTLAVLGFAALITAVLPFHTDTPEILARVRPTTLDLGIAVFSGLAGAVVTVARERRLSGAIPGVAVSVALIPPLAVAGFGLGTGRWSELVRGSLLLYGANLAGIVLSAMLVFLGVGMSRRRVRETAVAWHREQHATGLADRVVRPRWTRSLGTAASPLPRLAAVAAVALLLAVPLTTSLRGIAREVRVKRAVTDAEALFARSGRAAVLGDQVLMGDGRTQVYLRIATDEWFGSEARKRFERRASASAHEPVHLTLEQIPASAGDVQQLATLLPAQEPHPPAPPPPPDPARSANLVHSLDERVSLALGTLELPAGVRLLHTRVALGGDSTTLEVAYAAPEPLPAEHAALLAQQLESALGGGVRARFVHRPADDP